MEDINKDIKILEEIKDMFIYLKNYGWINDIKKDIDTDKAIQAIENIINRNKEPEEENRNLKENQIIKNKEIRNGQPVIANTRLTVLDVLYLMTAFIKRHEEEFRKDYADISINQIISAIDYFIDNSIPISLVGEKIDKTKFYIPEYQGEFVAIEDLQELLEKRK